MSHRIELVLFKTTKSTDLIDLEQGVGSTFVSSV